MKALFPEPVFLEEKPAFHTIPAEILDKIAAIMKEPIIAGTVARGGISAGASFILTLSSGRKIFAKGSHPGEMAHGAENIRQEISAYRTETLLASLAPEFLGEASDGDEDGWFLGLWRYVEKNPSAPDALQIVKKMAAWHAKTASGKIRHSRPMPAFMSFFFRDEKKWRRICGEENTRQKFLSLFEDPAAGNAWLEKSGAALRAAQARACLLSSPCGLIHGDLRMDNIFSDVDGRIYIVDWPNACSGPSVFDLVFLFSDMESLGLAMIEDCFNLYREQGGLDIKEEDRIAVAATLAGYFADQAYREVPVKLPRLRWKQKSQLLALLRFLTRLGMFESIPRMIDENR